MITFTILFLALMLLSVAIALVDWRRGWLLAILVGVLQDPARKLTPGTPVVMSLSIVLIYFVVIFASQKTLQAHARDFSRRFGNVFGGVTIVLFFLVLAAVNGVFTFGLDGWKAPALSLFIYLTPIPAVILGYAYLQREEQLYGLFRFYALITSIALIGTPLEYMRLDWRVLGTVALHEDNLRMMTGLTIRMLSGFYRGPDIMGLHAAILTMIGMIMSLRTRSIRRVWIWILVSGWGFFNCLISGRRKALYMIAVFVIAFLWRYVRRLSMPQGIAVAFLSLLMVFVVSKVSHDETSSAYTQGASTSKGEIFDRLEGGLQGTVEQSGIMGGGLGTATQGAYHVLGESGIARLGWQEGGLGKLAMELGVPGLVAVAILAVAMLLTMLNISKHPDVPGSSQLTRAALFGIVVANVVEFLASAQAYSDPVLTLLAAFFVGCTFASAALDERLAASEAPDTAVVRRPLTSPATA
jgi:Ca2+/Na+ antiporter